MSRKNESSTPISEEENTQLQQLFEHYHQIAQNLRESTNQSQAEAALAAIVAPSEAVQMALLKTLSKENTTDAADVLTAINAFSPNKEVRKEARRSLIRLDSAKIYPRWTPPIAQASAIRVNTVNPPRFWKGVVTQTREEGELQLVLCWEQGYDYSEIRSFGFLLEFWHEGVKDAFIETTGRRAIDKRIDDMRTKAPDVQLVDCTLAEGKRLLEEALSINTWRGTEPHKDFRNRLPIINQFILQAADIGEDRGRTFINTELEDQETIVNFLGSWSVGDYGLAYDLLTDGSNARNGLSRDEWIERHRAWYDEAHPTRLELGFARERERSQSAIWVPNSALSRSPVRKDIEIGWSLELIDTPLSGTIRELPMGTAINKETGRHWFWTSYTIERTPDGWRIQNITDEGANIQGLSIPELQKRIKEDEDTIEAKMKQRDENVNALLQELTWRVTQLLHFYDALIVKLPFDRQVNEEAYSQAVFAGNPERILVYLERMAQRFPNNRGELLGRLGATLVGVAYNYAQRGMVERRDMFLKRAEETLRESITVQDTATSHMLLGELLLSEERNDEAEEELLRAKSMSPTSAEDAAIETGLGNIAMRRERLDEAILHYQRVADLQPDYVGIRFNLGFAHRLLGHFDEAEANYKRAIQAEPTDIRSYSELTAIYMNQDNKEKAREIMAQGIQANPDSAHLHALFASVLSELGENRSAQRELQEAESIDPSLEIVQSVRQYLNDAKKR